jgi:UDP-glucose 4-epimerase
VHSPLPYDEVDAPLLTRDPMAVVARHWPEAPAMLDAAGAELWGPVRAWYDVGRAERELGWRARYDFGAFVNALRAGASDAAAMPVQP